MAAYELHAWRLIHPATGSKGEWYVVSEYGDIVYCSIKVSNPTVPGLIDTYYYGDYEGYHIEGWIKDHHPNSGLEVEYLKTSVELPD